MYYIVARYRRGRNGRPNPAGNSPSYFRTSAAILKFCQWRVFWGGPVRRGRLLITLGVELGRVISRRTALKRDPRAGNGGGTGLAVAVAF